LSHFPVIDDDRLVVLIDVRNVPHVARGSVVEEGPVIPVSHLIADSNLAETVVNAAVESYARAPVALIKNEDAIGPAPITRARRPGSGTKTNVPGTQKNPTRETSVVGQAKPPSTQLLPQNTILLFQVFDYLSVLLVDPTGHGDQQEPTWIERSGYLAVSPTRNHCLAGTFHGAVKSPASFSIDWILASMNSGQNRAQIHCT
jgi:hypothetical protein